MDVLTVRLHRLVCANGETAEWYLTFDGANGTGPVWMNKESDPAAVLQALLKKATDSARNGGKTV